MSPSPSLRLLAGGLRRRLGELELVASVPQQAPFSVDRLVVEEDTWRVVGASPEWHVPAPEHPVRLHTALVFDTPALLGSVVCRGRRWHAVVVDLDGEPLVAVTSVSTAYAAVAALCERHAPAGLGVPLLGCIHGDLDPARALAVLRAGLLDNPPARLRRVWLQVPQRHWADVAKELAGWGEQAD